ncbi:AAA family ATPase [Streptomyces geranii]|uniref:AAA family ATPase n=1 Tax=Streptomyces geranii TaxID=2058923 RepID=UPI000D1C6745|nr:AAA family ATPase [Streptomyces geranii]
MTDDLEASEVMRRHFVALATGTYEHPIWPPLPVQDEVRVLREWLCNPALGPDRSFTARFPSLCDDPSLREIQDLLNPEGGLPWNESDAAVVFVTGHGTTSERGLTHWTVLRTTVPGKRLPATALRTADLLSWLAATDIQYLFLVLDMCFAGATAAQITEWEADIPPTWLVLPSATRDTEALPGALTNAISEFLADLESPSGRKYAGREVPYLSVEMFLGEVRRRLSKAAGRLVPLQGSQENGPHPCLPNPCYVPGTRVSLRPALRDMALPKEDLLQHWSPRSRGVATQEEPGWFFEGREALMRELISVCSGSPGIVLVTGCAGSGKSAVLARLATLSDPEFRTEHHDRIAAVLPGLDPGVNSVDVAVVCTGKTPVEIAAQICLALGIDAPVSSRTVATTAEWINTWHAWLRLHRSAVTLVVDALDEASSPHDVLDQVLTRLAAGASRPWVRLLVGVRSPRREASGATADSDRVRPLADHAERVLGARRLRVDEAPWWRPDDIASYAENLLLSTPGSPYAQCPEATATVSKRLADRAEQSFLTVRLAASSLARRDQMVDPDDPRWLRAVDEGITGVFRDDLRATLTSEEDRERAVHLLHAVSLANGKGIPWARIWPSMATCVQDDGTRSYGDADISWLLDSRMGAYLVTDTEDSTTVYRLFHDALRNLLRNSWHRLTEPDANNLDDESSPPPAQHVQAEQASIARALISLAGESLSAATPPPAYVRRHAAVHAYAGGVLDNQLINPHLLPYLDISQLWQLNGLQDTLPHREATLLRAARGAAFVWSHGKPTVNAMALGLRLTELGLPAPEPLPGVEWHPEWANWAPTTAVSIGSATRATAELPDGRTVAVTETDDRKTVVLDLVSGQPIGAPLEGRVHGAVRLSDGRVIVVVQENPYRMHATGVVNLVDLVSRTAVTTPIKGDVEAVVSLSDGASLAVTTTVDRKMAVSHVWDIEKAQSTGVSFKGRVIAVFTLPDARCFAVVSAEGKHRPRLSIRTLRDGALVHNLPPLLHDQRLDERACIATLGPAEARRILLVHKTSDRLDAWDLLTGLQEHRPPAADILKATATASLPDGTDALVVADDAWKILNAADGTTLDWPPGTPGLRPVTHLAGAWAVSRSDTVGGAGPFLQLADGRHMAITQRQHHSYLHDVENSRLQRREAIRHSNPTGSGTLNSGRKVMLSPGDAGVVHVLDYETGDEIGSPFRHQRTIRDSLYALDAKTAVLPNGRNVALSVGADGAWLWDLDSREPLKNLYPCSKNGIGCVETLTTHDGQVLGIVGHQRANVAVFDLSDGSQIGSSTWPLGSTDDWSVHCIAATHDVEGTPIAVITNQSDRATVFDLRNNHPARELVVGHSLRGRHCIAAASSPGGRTYALLGPEIWDPSLNDRAGRIGGRLGVLQTDSATLRAVSMTALDTGEVVAFTVSADGWVRAHSIPDGRLISEPLPSLGKAYRVTAEAAQEGSCRLTLYGRYGWAEVTWRPNRRSW